MPFRPQRSAKLVSEGAKLSFDEMVRRKHSTRMEIADRILGDLKAGRLDLRNALRQPRCWVADVQEDAAISALWRVDFDSVPEDVLPRAGTMLTPELESLIEPGCCLTD